MTEIEELVKKMTEASDAYYNTGTPVLSDQAYDLMRDRLKELDQNNPFLKVIGAPVLGEAVEHKVPMGSQEKVKDEKEFRDFMLKMAEAGETQYSMEWKLDGCTVALYYEKGKLTRAVTRGDGKVGEDITSNVMKMANVKKVLIDKGFTGVLRGEIMLKISDFKSVFEPLGYKNPRNTVSGMSRDRKENPYHRYFRPIYFDLSWLSDSPVKDETLTDRINYMQKALGLETVQREILDPQLIWTKYKELEVKRPSLDYEIDGVIVKCESTELNERLGMSSDLRPKAQRCIKFTSMGAITKLLSVELSIGHTGAIIPTAKVAPVQIGGVTVTSCLLNNYEEIERLGVALNDDVDIIRAGDVIPKITSVAKKSPDRIIIEIPTKCISCGSTLEKDGAHIFCKNDDCEGKAIRRLKTWVTKREIKFLGDELLITLYERGYKEPQDIYRLSEKDISTMPRGAGVVGSAAKQIMIEINKSRKCSLADFIGSLAIKLMGRRQAEILINQGIDSLEKFVVLSVEQLNVLPGFSEDGSKATSIVDGLKKSRPIIKALIESGIEIEEVAQKVVIDPNGPLKGCILVFTGALPSRMSRDVAWDITRKAGGEIKDSITKGVTYLVIADPNSNSTKTQKAKKYGIKCISEEEWRGLIGDYVSFQDKQ